MNDARKTLICDGCGAPICGNVNIRGGNVLCDRCAHRAPVKPDAVQSAQLTLASATNRRLSTEEVIELCTMLESLSAELDRFQQLARQLTEARERGNSEDMWRAIGEIEGLSHSKEALR